VIPSIQTFAGPGMPLVLIWPPRKIVKKSV